MKLLNVPDYPRWLLNYPREKHNEKVPDPEALSLIISSQTDTFSCITKGTAWSSEVLVWKWEVQIAFLENTSKCVIQRPCTSPC